MDITVTNADACQCTSVWTWDRQVVGSNPAWNEPLPTPTPLIRKDVADSPRQTHDLDPSPTGSKALTTSLSMICSLMNWVPPKSVRSVPRGEFSAM